GELEGAPGLVAEGPDPVRVAVPEVGVDLHAAAFERAVGAVHRDASRLSASPSAARPSAVRVTRSSSRSRAMSPLAARTPIRAASATRSPGSRPNAPAGTRSAHWPP